MELNPKILPYSEWIQNNPELLESEKMCSQCDGSGIEDCDCDCNENCSLCWGNGEHKCFMCGGTGTDNTARWAYNKQVKKDRDRADPGGRLIFVVRRHPLTQ